MRILLLFLVLWFQSASAQLPPIGQWRDHFPHTSALDIAYTPTRVYALVKNGLFYYDFEDNSVNKLNKVNGLSDIGLSCIVYDAPSNRLVVGYSNGNIDIVNPSNNATVNLSDIKRSNIVGDKGIYGLLAVGGKAYLSTGFGIVYLDIEREEIKDSYFLAPAGSSKQVNQVCVLNDSIYAATETGIYKAFKNHPFLSDHTNWTQMTNLPATVFNKDFSNIVAFNNQVFASYRSGIFQQDTLYRFNGSGWTVFNFGPGDNVRRIQATPNRLMISFNYNIRIYDFSLTEIENIFGYTFANGMLPNSVVYGGGFYWIADRGQGMVKALSTWSNTRIVSDGPFASGANKVKISKSNVWVAHGVVLGAAWLNSYNQDFISGRVDDSWNSILNISDPSNLIQADSTFDFLSLAIDPDDKGHVFAGSFSFGGLFEIKDNTVIARYDENNSTLQSWVLRPGYCAIPEMIFDKDHNLWVMNAYVANPLSVKKADNTWRSYYLGSDIQNNIYREMIIGKQTGYFWIAVPGTLGGLFVWDHNGTLDDLNDDRSRMYKVGAGQGNLPSSDVLCVAEDLDEKIWIGTGGGLVVVYSQQAAFGTGNFDASQILIQQDGNIQILFETEVITGIAVDGANRKWVSTDGSGVYLISADGSEQIFHFTKENSPLLSNQVNDVEIDHLTGEVYFATSEGLISYRGTATIETLAFSEVYAFPNPVMPDYEGIIAIKGLGRDADVKITDISGNVVFVTKSEGGQAIWNGKNLKGERVATGVYTVLTNSSTGKGRAVAKILFY